MMMNKVVVLTTLFLLFSCKSYDVTPGAERVRVLDAEPKGCIYVGEVSSVQEDETVGTLETEMDLATRIDLRNKAHKLGGNIVVFLRGKNTNTLPGSSQPPAAAPKSGASSGGAATTAATDTKSAEVSTEEAKDSDKLVFLATVFRCPSSILNQ